jgi:hypothetical protein
MLFPQSFVRVWLFWESRLQHKFTWWLQDEEEQQCTHLNIVLWTFNLFCVKVQDFCLREHHFAVKKAIKSTILLTTNSDLTCYNIQRGTFNNLVQTLIIKIRENNSHCWSIVLKTMDRSIVKKMEKEKNSNFNVENCVVMFIYWGTINPDICPSTAYYYIDIGG